MNKHKHDWVFMNTSYGAITKLPWILVVLFHRVDFYRRNFICSICGEIKFIDVKEQQDE